MKFHRDGTLPTNGEIFVFGSNLAGIHGAGAAKVAATKFGAKYGVGIGMTGQSWAIPTKNLNIETMPLDDIVVYVNKFVKQTQTVDLTEFFVTRVGCGLAGYTDAQIAPMFRGAKNCSFAEEWKEFLMKPDLISDRANNHITIPLQRRVMPTIFATMTTNNRK